MASLCKLGHHPAGHSNCGQRHLAMHFVASICSCHSNRTHDVCAPTLQQYIKKIRAANTQEERENIVFKELAKIRQRYSTNKKCTGAQLSTRIMMAPCASAVCVCARASSLAPHARKLHISFAALAPSPTYQPHAKPYAPSLRHPHARARVCSVRAQEVHVEAALLAHDGLRGRLRPQAGRRSDPVAALRREAGRLPGPCPSHDRGTPSSDTLDHDSRHVDASYCVSARPACSACLRCAMSALPRAGAVRGLGPPPWPNTSGRPARHTVSSHCACVSCHRHLRAAQSLSAFASRPSGSTTGARAIVHSIRARRASSTPT